MRINSTIPENERKKSYLGIYIIVGLFALVIGVMLKFFGRLLKQLFLLAVDHWGWAVGFVIAIFILLRLLRRNKKR